MLAILIYTLLCAASFYLGSRAKITSWLWLRYPPALASFMDCAACSGFWYGVIWSLVLRLDVGLRVGRRFAEPVLVTVEMIGVGLMMLVLTPIAAGIMQRGLEHVGSAVDAPPID